MSATPDLPEAPLLALAGRWDLTQGEHPALVAPLASLLTKLPLFPSAEEWAELAGLGLPLGLAERGHHVLLDSGPDHAANPAVLDEIPLAPVFVRDLCGRVIHTGLLPLPNPPELPTFPAGCADVPATMGGAGHLESSLFTYFTRLELAPAAGVQLAGGAGAELRAAYAAPASYPYKIRPQTFYADGWRLPQVARVFARRVPRALEVADERLMQLWARWPKDQDYEAFYESHGGAAWFEELFLQGVTVIPTLEGYNGAYQVADDFSVQGVEGGRAVAGLHKVVAREASPLPAGTILRVVSPGFVTAQEVLQAHVVVSSGPSLAPDDALLPNLALHHPHLSGAWGACWLPTKPHHFREPALWDWLPGGHFVQVSGPLWCPERYVYASTPGMVRAAARPKPECPTLLQQPASFASRFFPAVALTGYDTISERTRQERAPHADHALRGSALDHLPLMKPVATLGYHAMPPEWPRLTQSAIFPAQRHTVQGACPPDMASRLAPLAEGLVPPAELESHHVVLSEPQRQVLEEAMRTAPTPQPTSQPVCWLPEISASQLQVNVKRLFANRSYRAALALLDEKLPEALFRFRESALAWRRLRYRLATKYAAALERAEEEGLSLESAEVFVQGFDAPHHAHALNRRSLGLTRVPALSALALPKGASTARLKRK